MSVKTTTISTKRQKRDMYKSKNTPHVPKEGLVAASVQKNLPCISNQEGVDLARYSNSSDRKNPQEGGSKLTSDSNNQKTASLVQANLETHKSSERGSSEARSLGILDLLESIEEEEEEIEVFPIAFQVPAGNIKHYVPLLLEPHSSSLMRRRLSSGKAGSYQSSNLIRHQKRHHTIYSI